MTSRRSPWRIRKHVSPFGGSSRFVSLVISLNVATVVGRPDSAPAPPALPPPDVPRLSAQNFDTSYGESKNSVWIWWHLLSLDLKSSGAAHLSTSKRNSGSSQELLSSKVSVAGRVADFGDCPQVFASANRLLSNLARDSEHCENLCME
jgi:hypothetical protein